MEHYKIFKMNKSYHIYMDGCISVSMPIENKIIDLCIDILYTWGRHKEIGKRFYELSKKGVSMDISEFEMIKLIDIFLKQKWNVRSGTFFKDYYYNSFPNAKDELLRLFPNGF